MSTFELVERGDWASAVNQMSVARKPKMISSIHVQALDDLRGSCLDFLGKDIVHDDRSIDVSKLRETCDRSGLLYDFTSLLRFHRKPEFLRKTCDCNKRLSMGETDFASVKCVAVGATRNLCKIFVDGESDKVIRSVVCEYLTIWYNVIFSKMGCCVGFSRVAILKPKNENSPKVSGKLLSTRPYSAWIKTVSLRKDCSRLDISFRSNLWTTKSSYSFYIDFSRTKTTMHYLDCYLKSYKFYRLAKFEKIPDVLDFTKFDLGNYDESDPRDVVRGLFAHLREECGLSYDRESLARSLVNSDFYVSG